MSFVNMGKSGQTQVAGTEDALWLTTSLHQHTSLEHKFTLHAPGVKWKSLLAPKIMSQDDISSFGNVSYKVHLNGTSLVSALFQYRL